ncbi:hypothetical protein THAOC_28478, partial [Thalassiosira oceanica]
MVSSFSDVGGLPTPHSDHSDRKGQCSVDRQQLDGGDGYGRTTKKKPEDHRAGSDGPASFHRRQSVVVTLEAADPLGADEPSRTRKMKRSPTPREFLRNGNRTRVFLLYEGGKVTEELSGKITHVRVGPQVKEIPVAIPSSVTKLGNEAFLGCSKLSKVQLNEGLKIIGERTFALCTSLGSVTIPSTVTVLGESAFIQCTALQSLIVPSATKLGGYACYCCSNLAKVQLNEGLEIIGKGTFSGCKALQKVTVPSTVTELGNEAFKGCDKLVEVQLNEGMQKI